MNNLKNGIISLDNYVIRFNLIHKILKQPENTQQAPPSATDLKYLVSISLARFEFELIPSRLNLFSCIYSTARTTN